MPFAPSSVLVPSTVYGIRVFNFGDSEIEHTAEAEIPCCKKVA